MGKTYVIMEPILVMVKRDEDGVHSTGYNEKLGTITRGHNLGVMHQQSEKYIADYIKKQIDWGRVEEFLKYRDFKYYVVHDSTESSRDQVVYRWGLVTEPETWNLI